LKIFRTVTAQRLLGSNQENVMRIENWTSSRTRYPEVRRARASRLASLAPQHDARGASKGGRFACVAAFAVMLGATPTLADESATDLETVVVTATRTPQPLDKTATSM